ncbi:Protein FMP52, mitochondrial [Lipomyces doorenjongii]
MAALAIVGATGLVGSNFLALSRTAELPGISAVVAITRRPVKESLTTGATHKVSNVVTTDIPASMPPTTTLLFSGLGTTRAAAGGFDNQYKIDHDLNLAIAKTAKAVGASTYVLVSATGASVDSRFAYNRMKGELDRDVEALEFERTIILRPALILGKRENRHAFLEGSAQGAVNFWKKVPFVGNAAKWIGADAEDIAKAALKAIQKGGSGVEIYGNEAILKLAKEYDDEIEAKSK